MQTQIKAIETIEKRIEKFFALHANAKKPNKKCYCKAFCVTCKRNKMQHEKLRTVKDSQEVRILNKILLNSFMAEVPII